MTYKPGPKDESLFDIRNAHSVSNHPALAARLTALTSTFPRVANEAVISALHDLFNNAVETAETATDADTRQSAILTFMGLMLLIDEFNEKCIQANLANSLAKRIASEIEGRPPALRAMAERALRLHKEIDFNFACADSIRQTKA